MVDEKENPRVPLIIYLDKKLYERIKVLVNQNENATINDIISICIRIILPTLENGKSHLLSKFRKKVFPKNDPGSN